MVLPEMKVDGFNPENLDVLREIGNIGAGNAVTSLAAMLGREIDMSVPVAQIVDFNEISNLLNGPETFVAGVLVDMVGDLNGYILLVLEITNAYELVSMVLGDDRTPPENISTADFGEMEMSALTEISNILIGSYLSSLCTLTNLSIQPTVPSVAMDMLGAIMSIVAIQYGQIGDSVLLLSTKFSDMDKEMAGNFFLVPDYESYKRLMSSLGMDA